jgi:hypothetical protein
MLPSSRRRTKCCTQTRTSGRRQSFHLAGTQFPPPLYWYKSTKKKTHLRQAAVFLPFGYSFCSLYWYESTNTDAEGAGSVVPFRGIVMYATPLCYLYANPPDLYFTYRALYAQVLNLLALLVLGQYKSTKYATPLCYLYATPPDLYFTYRALYAQVLNSICSLYWYLTSTKVQILAQKTAHPTCTSPTARCTRRCSICSRYWYLTSTKVQILAQKTTSSLPNCALHSQYCCRLHTLCMYSLSYWYKSTNTDADDAARALHAQYCCRLHTLSSNTGSPHFFFLLCLLALKKKCEFWY